ncbi:hypothetical protein [Telluribacter sp.]|jgi:hypothetical protein|nr:hypothetical protein [Telluribacter sp.]
MEEDLRTKVASRRILLFLGHSGSREAGEDSGYGLGIAKNNIEIFKKD